jgi:hypothetical protein
MNISRAGSAAASIVLVAGLAASRGRGPKETPPTL